MSSAKDPQENELVEITVYSPFNDMSSCHHWYDSLESAVSVWGEHYHSFYKFNIWIVASEKVCISDEP